MILWMFAQVKESVWLHGVNMSALGCCRAAEEPVSVVKKSGDGWRILEA